MSVYVCMCVPLCVRTCRVESLHLATAFLRRRIVSIVGRTTLRIEICVRLSDRESILIDFFSGESAKIFEIPRRGTLTDDRVWSFR